MREEMINIHEMEFEVFKRLLDINSIEHSFASFQDFESTISGTEITRVGLNTSFAKDSGAKIASNNRILDGVCALINGTIETSFVVKLEDGQIVWLEGFCYGDDEFPSKIQSFEIFEENIQRF